MTHLHLKILECNKNDVIEYYIFSIFHELNKLYPYMERDKHILCVVIYPIAVM